MKNKFILVVCALLSVLCLFACDVSGTPTTSLKVEIHENMLTWNEIEEANSYQVLANDTVLKSTYDTYYELNEVYGSYTIVIKALLDDDKYILSNEIKYINIMKVTDSVNLIAINDTHGAIVDDSNNVGIAKVSTFINEFALTGSDAIKIANGDMFQGTYASNSTKGKLMVDCLNAMEFDLMVIGNHEFDWGIEEIAKYKDGNLSNGEASFPILAANIIDKRTSSTLPWTEDYAIIENNGYKVGVIGVIGEYLTSSIATDKIANYRFLDPVPIVEQLSAKLRTEENCDVVIVSTHEYEEYTNARYASLSGDSRIDGIICAHTHQKISETVYRGDGYEIPVMQSNTKNISLGQLRIKMENGKAKSSNINHYYLNNYVNDEKIEKIIDGYKDILNEGERIVGSSSRSLSRNSLGLIATASMRDMFKVDFGCMNTGGVRTTLDAGDVRVRDIYDVFPFDNEIYIVEITGKKLKELYDNHGDFLYFDQLFMSSSLDYNKTYKLAVIDYVFTSNYYTSIFSTCKYTKTAKYIRDAVCKAFEDKKVSNYY